MTLITDVVVILADLTVCWECFGFCSSALYCTVKEGDRVLGIFLTTAAFGTLGLFELVVCFGAWGGLISPAT